MKKKSKFIYTLLAVSLTFSIGTQKFNNTNIIKYTTNLSMQYAHGDTGG